jgi:hypothetical protein
VCEYLFPDYLQLELPFAEHSLCKLPTQD